MVLDKLNLKHQIQIGDSGWAGFRDDWARERLKVISTEAIIEITGVNEVTKKDLSIEEPCRFLQCLKAPIHSSRLSLRLGAISGKPSLITTFAPTVDSGIPSLLPQHPVYAPNRAFITLYYC